jgi:uncharacterized lipoprotein YmbA
MKKNYYFVIAIVAYLWTACGSTKSTTVTTTTDEVTKTPEKEMVAERPTPNVEQPVVEELNQGKKGIGATVQAAEQGLQIEEEKVMPVPDVVIPPLSKEEEERFRQVLEAAKKKKKG